MNLKPLTAERVSKLFALEELTALGETPNGEMFGRILTKVVVAQRDQDQKIMTDVYEALKDSTTIIHNQIRYETGEHREYLQRQLRANLKALYKVEGKNEQS